MKSIDFRLKYFLILYPSLSRLAIWIERIAVKVEIVGSSLTTYNIFFLNIYIFYHKSWLARFSRNTQGGTAHHIFNILSRQLGSAEEPFSE